MGTYSKSEMKDAQRLRGVVGALAVGVLVLVVATLPRPARAAALTFPGPAPCGTTLQACIDGAAPGDVVEIATNGPIDESPQIEKSLTLRPATGFTPRFAGPNTLTAITSGSEDLAITIQGLTFEIGSIAAGHGGTGQFDLKILDNVIEQSFQTGNPAIRVFTGTQGDLRGLLLFEVSGNVMTVPPPFGGQAAGISVSLSLAPEAQGRIAQNRIVMEGNTQQGAIDIANGNNMLTVDVSGNRISGTGFSEGISLFQFSDLGVLQARVINNLISGQVNVAGAPGAISANASQGALQITIVNNTVVNNERGILVNGRADLGASLSGLVANNMIVHSSEGGLGIDSAFAATVLNRNNLLFANASNSFVPGPGTVFEDPLFLGLDDFHLAAGSPAIDAGDNSAVPPDIAADLDGKPRILDGDADSTAVTDIGAYEAGDASKVLFGLGEGGDGWLEIVAPTEPHDHRDWLRVPWSAYNSAVGETRPVTCDVDGDARDEVVIGLGSFPSNGGWVEVRDDATTDYAHLAWLRVGWAGYNAANGETFPACGDLDGDGRDELVLGLGTGGGGWVQLRDDALSGYAPVPGTPSANGWLRLDWTAYNTAQGAVHPAVGNLDGDAAEELVLGVGTGGGGWLQLRDDASAGFGPLAGTPAADGWVRVQWNGYNTANGETRPVVCDLNGDGQGELGVGLGTGSAGWFQLFDATAGFAPLTGTPTADGWGRVSWAAYTSTGGGTRLACGHLDGDPGEELVVGLDSFPSNGGWVEVKEDLAQSLAHRSWARVTWSTYNGDNGETRPAVGR